MRTNSRRVVACLAALVLTVSACGAAPSEEDDVGVASLVGDEPAGGPSDIQDQPGSEDEAGEDPPEVDREAPEDAELAFALYDECMADAGFDFSTAFEGDDSEGVQVQELEAPVEGDPQQGDVDDLDFGEAFQAADEECQQHLAALDLSFDMTPEQEAAMEDAQLAWAECMRDQGVDVPDFDPDGNSAGVVVIGPDGDDDDPQAGGINDLDFEAFEEAAEQCDGVFDEIADELGLESDEAGS